MPYDPTEISGDTVTTCEGSCRAHTVFADGSLGEPSSCSLGLSSLDNDLDDGTGSTIRFLHVAGDADATLVVDVYARDLPSSADTTLPERNEWTPDTDFSTAGYRGVFLFRRSGGVWRSLGEYDSDGGHRLGGVAEWAPGVMIAPTFRKAGRLSFISFERGQLGSLPQALPAPRGMEPTAFDARSTGDAMLVWSDREGPTLRTQVWTWRRGEPTPSVEQLDGISVGANLAPDLETKLVALGAGTGAWLAGRNRRGDVRLLRRAATSWVVSKDWRASRSWKLTIDDVAVVGDAVWIHIDGDPDERARGIWRRRPGEAEIWEQVYAPSAERAVKRMMPLASDILLVATESLAPPLHSRIERIKMREAP